MANYIVQLLSILFLLAVLVQGQGDIGLCYIGTSRGVITAIQTASGYVLREKLWVDPEYYLDQIFTAATNGEFIYYGAGDSNVVWDITGAKYTAGTPIGLFARKSGASAANQEWTITAGYNKIVSKHSPNMVANVSAGGYLTLAPATSVPAQSAYQRMYLIYVDEIASAEIFNMHNTSVLVQATSYAGPWNLTVNASSNGQGQDAYQAVCGGTVITFTDATGKQLGPPYEVYVSGSLIRIPQLDLPDNITTNWSGNYKLNPSSNAVNSISIVTKADEYHDGGDITGNGTDSVFGKFNITGYYTWKGQVNITYSYATLTGIFAGLFNELCTSILGNYTIANLTNVNMVLNKST